MYNQTTTRIPTPSNFFSPIINTTHSRHLESTIEYPQLLRYIYQNQHHLPPRVLFALITIVNPSIAACDHLLTQIPDLDWTTTLLECMNTLENPPKRNILTLHPYTQFTYKTKTLFTRLISSQRTLPFYQSQLCNFTIPSKFFFLLTGTLPPRGIKMQRLNTCILSSTSTTPYTSPTNL